MIRAGRSEPAGRLSPAEATNQRGPFGIRSLESIEQPAAGVRAENFEMSLCVSALLVSIAQGVGVFQGDSFLDDLLGIPSMLGRDPGGVVEEAAVSPLLGVSQTLSVLSDVRASAMANTH